MLAHPVSHREKSLDLRWEEGEGRGNSGIRTLDPGP